MKNKLTKKDGVFSNSFHRIVNCVNIKHKVNLKTKEISECQTSDCVNCVVLSDSVHLHFYIFVYRFIKCVI